MKYLLFVLFIIASGSCKSSVSQEYENTPATVVEQSPTITTNPNCLAESDSVAVRMFVQQMIVDLEQQNGKSFASNLEFPMTMFNFNFDSAEDFVEQWQKNDTLMSYLSLEIYDEDDEYIGNSTLENTEFLFYNSEQKDDCWEVQFGLGSGLIFTLDKIEGKIKVVNFDIAG